MKKIPYILLFSLLAVPYAKAQYDQNIAVEGKYVPDYIDHDRIGIFPQPVRFSLEKSTLEYSLSGTNADFTPMAVPIQATGWQTTRNYIPPRGYLELGAGSWLESTLSAGYRIIDKRESVLGLRLQHNSTSLWKPELSDGLNTKTARYDESLGIYGHHIFGDKGRLEAAVDYHLGTFNYYGFNPLFPIGAIPNTDIKAPTQTLNDIAGRIGWFSISDPDKFAWHVSLGARYFGYRRYYLPEYEGNCPALTGGRETDIKLNGGIVIPASSKSYFGLDLNADVISYGTPELRAGAYGSSYRIPELDTYGMVSLTPYYKFSRSKLNIFLGARVDLSVKAGPENERYDFFHIAPNVRLDYNAGPVQLFFYALGGSSLHTLADGYEFDYYQAPFLSATTPVYTPVDAKAGFTFGPFSGFHAGFDVAFRTSRGQYYGGFYQAYISNMEDALFLPDYGYQLPEKIDERPVDYSFAPGAKSNLSGFSFGLNAGYDAGRYFKISADGHFQHQNGKTGYFNGYDRPEWTTSVSVETNPWSTLKFKIGYELRAMRMMPVRAHYADTSPLNSHLTVMYRLPNLSMLNLGASYSFSDKFNVWIQADNILNKTVYYMPGLPEPGIRVAAGIGLYF